jgi:cold shock CspA family protein
VKGTIKRVDPTGHGIIQREDGSKFPFLFVDVLSRRALAAGERVIFSIRIVQDKVFAQNISYEAERSGQGDSGTRL